MDSSVDSKTLDSEVDFKVLDSASLTPIDLSNFAPEKKHVEILSQQLSRTFGALACKVDEKNIYIVLQNPQSAQDAKDTKNADTKDSSAQRATPATNTQNTPTQTPTDTSAQTLIAHHLAPLGKRVIFCQEQSFCFAWQMKAFAFVEDFYTQNSVESKLDFLLQEAIALESSDIHIESKAEFVSIRFRIDGVLREIGRIDAAEFGKLSTKMKLDSSLDITETRLPQDGRTQKTFGGVEYDFRISCVPLALGESIVVRILYKHASRISLDMLGLDSDTLSDLRRSIMRKSGLILVAGPTGSGKSTTLYALLEELKTLQKKLITIEDPIEYQIQQACQIQLNPEIGFSFYEALKSVLRQDPDIIMVGEIRDKDTLDLALNASLTGHLVLASLHSNDCIVSLERLFEMGASRSVIETSLLCIVAQRLACRLCAHCKAKVAQGFESRGCEKCGGTGIQGRTLIAQSMFVDEELKQVFWQAGGGASVNRGDAGVANANMGAGGAVDSSGARGVNINTGGVLDSGDWRTSLRHALLAREIPTLKSQAMKKREIIDWREIENIE